MTIAAENRDLLTSMAEQDHRVVSGMVGQVVRDATPAGNGSQTDHSRQAVPWKMQNRQRYPVDSGALSRDVENADFESQRKLVAMLLPRAHGCGVVMHRDGKIEIKGILALPGDAEGVELRASVRLNLTRL